MHRFLPFANALHWLSQLIFTVSIFCINVETEAQGG